MSIAYRCASLDAIDVVDLGVLAGDVPKASGIHDGDNAARFLDALRERKVLLADSVSAHEALLDRVGGTAMLTREMAARLIHATGIGRGTIAQAWAQGVGRIAPTVLVKFAAGPLGRADVSAGCKIFQAATRRFTGVAYAGGVITDHPMFSRVAFDLSSTEFKTPAPILFGHKEPIGVIDSAQLGGNISIDGHLFSDVSGPARNVVDMAERGMPWQLSVGIFPGKTDTLAAGKSLTLNGGKVDGPLTVFRDNRIRETSIVPLGADDRTSVSIAG